MARQVCDDRERYRAYTRYLIYRYRPPREIFRVSILRSRSLIMRYVNTMFKRTRRNTTRVKYRPALKLIVHVNCMGLIKY